MNLNFREWQFPSEDKNDFDIVRDILYKTWLTTYSKIVPPEDLKTFLDLTCSDEKLLKLYNDSNIKGIIAEADGKPVGWLRTNINSKKNKFYINQIYVLKEYQGKGIGKKLIQIAEKEASRNNYDKIWLGVMTENIPSVEWYKSIGFTFVKEIPFTMVNTTINHLFGWKKVENIK